MQQLCSWHAHAVRLVQYKQLIEMWGSFAIPDGVILPVELLLQALVCVVDAQLLKAVLFEAFKAVDIQNAQRGFCLLLAH